jgi:gluconate 5-dehydrogenase
MRLPLPRSAGAGIHPGPEGPGTLPENKVDDDEFNAWILGRTPARRWGTVADVVGPTVWLASSASDYVNGQIIFVDGGMTVVV